MSYTIGDHIGLPEEPEVNTKLRPTGTANPDLELIRLGDGWYYTGHLNFNGRPNDGVKPWDWAYVVTTHRDLDVVE